MTWSEVMQTLDGTVGAVLIGGIGGAYLLALVCGRSCPDCPHRRRWCVVACEEKSRELDHYDRKIREGER